MYVGASGSDVHEAEDVVSGYYQFESDCCL